MPEQQKLSDLLAILDRVVTEGQALSAVEWTIDYEHGEKRNVMVIVIPEPRAVTDVERLAGTLMYVMDASDYAPTEVLRAALVAPRVNLNLTWEKENDAKETVQNS